MQTTLPINSSSINLYPSLFISAKTVQLAVLTVVGKFPMFIPKICQHNTMLERQQHSQSTHKITWAYMLSPVPTTVQVRKIYCINFSIGTDTGGRYRNITVLQYTFVMLGCVSDRLFSYCNQCSYKSFSVRPGTENCSYIYKKINVCDKKMKFGLD